MTSKKAPAPLQTDYDRYRNLALAYLQDPAQRESGNDSAVRVAKGQAYATLALGAATQGNKDTKSRPLQRTKTTQIAETVSAKVRQVAVSAPAASGSLPDKPVSRTSRTKRSVTEK